MGTFAFEYKQINPSNSGEAVFEISIREEQALENFANYSYHGLDDPKFRIYKELPQKGRKSTPATHRKHLVPQCTSLVTRARAGEEDAVAGADMMLILDVVEVEPAQSALNGQDTRIKPDPDSPGASPGPQLEEDIYIYIYTL
ncbi:hypothetical protein ACLMJK_000072 [Lecanora helva]